MFVHPAAPRTVFTGKVPRVPSLPPRSIFDGTVATEGLLLETAIGTSVIELASRVTVAVAVPPLETVSGDTVRDETAMTANKTGDIIAVDASPIPK
jgi:hypothetical protein